ncbi:MAG: FAA hydrolase family protein [Alphaproteobacteria bacterium]|nr:MAG: FAA hydrolase family protein [Alphaproteobacteria bacterium]
MKLASLKSGRDGQLVVVARDLITYVPATAIAPTMQAALDEWEQCAPKLLALYDDLNAGRAQHALPFDMRRCASPLPRAYQWADGSAYVNHVELVRKARNAPMPESFWHDPLIYQGGSDCFLDPHADIQLAEDALWGVDFEAEIAVVTGDVPMGITPAEAAQHIRLVMLVNDVSLRGLIPDELAKGFGFFHSKPSSSFSPVAVTPDELGAHWRDHKVTLPLLSYVNGALFGSPNAGTDMTFDFTQLIAHAAKTRTLTAGCIIGSGTVSNKMDGEAGKPIAEGGVGYSCIAELRMIETIQNGKPSTEFLRFGDHVRIEMVDDHGASIFGAIDQRVARYKG